MTRSSWKTPFVDFTLLKKVWATSPQKEIYTKSRRSSIISPFIGRTFHVHQGNKYSKVVVTNRMLGHKLGEFAFTRRIGKIHDVKNSKKRR